MALLGIFWAGCLYLLPMDLATLGTTELNVLLVNGLGLDLLDS
jgi:hypothetical protein